MATIYPNDFKRGMTIQHKGGLWTVVEYSSRKMGRGGANVTAKLKNVETGQVLEETWRSGEKIETAFVETKDLEYLYRNGDKLVLMDPETYEQPEVPAEDLGDDVDYLKEGGKVNVQIHDGKIISLTLPDFIELQVTEAPPHVKGDTATAELREVTMETGGTVKAPPHVKEGDVIQIDTRDFTYIKRVKQD